MISAKEASGKASGSMTSMTWKETLERPRERAWAMAYATSAGLRSAPIRVARGKQKAAPRASRLGHRAWATGQVKHAARLEQGDPFLGQEAAQGLGEQAILLHEAGQFAHMLRVNHVGVVRFSHLLASFLNAGQGHLALEHLQDDIVAAVHCFFLCNSSVPETGLAGKESFARTAYGRRTCCTFAQAWRASA
ncbi:hypothetical protein A4R35_00760 [Thermogemmatispora tikiterensis]|uniref:Uncharacterized protein n=1 Tax=Thermogemmatispora tikiterensis TaxID=1825093 RepID=A0A328VDJ1_9CHLR|nr:hypothetical protein A4R35_00760 [Thermogemmatispora tikiterensis]